MLKRKFIYLFLFLPFAKLYSQNANDSLHTKDKQELLNEYDKQATELYNAFKNGPAFDQLQNYGDLKEKIFKEKKEAELKQVETAFQAHYAVQQTELAEIKTSITDLNKENNSLEKEKQKLQRNTVLFFVCLLTLFTLLLYWRIRKAKKAQELADVSAIQLQHTSKIAGISDAVKKFRPDLYFAFTSLQELCIHSISSLAKLQSVAVGQKKNSEDLTKSESLINKINAASEAGAFLLSDKDLISAEDNELPVMTNLNNLITEIFDLSFYQIKSYDESFDCQRVKDLEKILPEILLFPESIRIALFHFLNNAFYSVYEKKKSAGKNYEPKISVSSRKLPRFVQVRIKDNGGGIADKLLEMIYQPFFTTKPPEIANGLGLTKAAEIIKKKHKGEIIIESEPGKGADFIIRFPLNNPM
jgi:hypothetical protein